MECYGMLWQKYDELLRQEAERHPTPNEIMGAKIAAEGFLRARSHDNIQWS
jgi:hypothetical protein